MTRKPSAATRSKICNGFRRTTLLRVLACVATLALSVVTPVMALAATGPTMSSNSWYNDYWVWAQPSKSALATNASGQLQRVEWIDNALVVETYSSDYTLLSQRTIEAQTYAPSNLATGASVLYGGFFAGSSANFVVTGQKNLSEDDSLVVVRVTKYSKSWGYQGSCEYKGINTYLPFDAGSCDMAEAGGSLYVRTCHEMYGDGGTHHQASMMFKIDESTMSSLGSMTKVLNMDQSEMGYVSHSFNQHLAVLGSTVYAVDHGDAHPRSIAVKRIGTTGSSSCGTVLSLEGDYSTNGNLTYATLGGAAASSTQNTILTVANKRQEPWTSMRSLSECPRNVWLCVTNASDLSSPTSYQLTDYDTACGYEASNPQIVKVSEDSFLVLWGVAKQGSYSTTGSDANTIVYAFYNGNGVRIGSESQVSARLSDCQPIVVGSKVIWYATGTDSEPMVPTFYSIDTSTGAFSSKSLATTITDSMVTVSNAEYAARQYVVTAPSATVTCDGQTLTADTDYTTSLSYDTENRYPLPGTTGSITVTGKGRYVGSVTKSFGVVGNLKSYRVSAWVEAAERNQAYTGQRIKPGVTVEWYEGSKSLYLVQGTDYMLSYENNVDVGTATITVTGIGSYTGSITRTFEITQAQQSSGGSGSGSNTNSGSGSSGSSWSKDNGGGSGSSGSTSSSGSNSGGSGASNGSSSAGQSGGWGGDSSSDTPGSGGSGSSGTSSSGGSGGSSAVPSDASNVPMYRVYNRWSGEHLFTADAEEYELLAQIGWSQEGIAWESPAEGDAVWRLYNPYSGDHFYTQDWSEYERLGSIGWNQEGVSFRSGGDLPIYRLFNPWLTAGTHLFTSDSAEYTDLAAIGWVGEGVAFSGTS